MRCTSLVFLTALWTATAESDCGCSQSRSQTAEALKEHDVLGETKMEVGQDLLPESDAICRASIHEKMVLVQGGEFSMGTNRPVILADGEHPARVKTVRSFWLDATEVSNEAFQKFVNETGHLTDAETIGDSFVLGSTILEPNAVRGAVQAAPWWFSVFGATWQSPEGPVHVSWTDAKRFCEHYGKRLPNEAEWEMACKKSLAGRKFPWDDDLTDAENQKSANIWQGQFPNANLKADGYEGTAPVDAYEFYPGLAVKNMIGNVWEWTADPWTTDHGKKPNEAETRRVKKDLLRGSREDINELLRRVKLPKLSIEEYEFLGCYRKILEPVAETLDILQGDQNVTYGCLLPAIRKLCSQLRELEDFDGTCEILRSKALQAVETRFADLLDAETSRGTRALIAAISHPFFKLRFLAPSERDEAKRRFASVVRKACSVTGGGSSSLMNESSANCQRDDPLNKFFRFDESNGEKSTAEFPDSDLEVEITRFLADERTDMKMLFGYERILKVFEAYNVGLPSSAPVERLFSRGSLTLGDLRGCLNDNHVEMLVLFSYNNYEFK